MRYAILTVAVAGLLGIALGLSAQTLASGFRALFTTQASVQNGPAASDSTISEVLARYSATTANDLSTGTSAPGIVNSTDVGKTGSPYGTVSTTVGGTSPILSPLQVTDAQDVVSSMQQGQ